MTILKKKDYPVWVARVLIGFVLTSNMQCTLAFIWVPARYSAALGVSGPTGTAVIRGFGLLFLMWNVPYSIALVHPVRHRISLIEAIIMQGIGLVGEAGIWLCGGLSGMPAADAIERFIWFDGIGLVFLLAAFFVTRRQASRG